MILTITLWLRQMKNQHLEVNFTFKVKINRLVTKGLGENYVKSFFLFYSKDGHIFKSYKLGSKNMVSGRPLMIFWVIRSDDHPF